MRPDELRQAIRKVRESTKAPFQVNLFVPDEVDYRPEQHVAALDKLKHLYAGYGVDFAKASTQAKDDFADQVQVLIEEQVPVVSFTFGIPKKDILSKLRKADCVLMGTATCVAEGRALADAKFDAIVAQGYEAGGHRGTFHTTLRETDEIPNVGLFALLPQLVNAVSVPVIASGGIMDGKGIIASLALGAVGCQLGTAFMGCPEAGLTNSWREALYRSSDIETSLTNVFSGRYARGIQNRFMADMDSVKGNLPPFPVLNSLTSPLRSEAKRRDDAAYQSLWAGQAAKLTRRLPARELMKTLVGEAETAVRRATARCAAEVAW